MANNQIILNMDEERLAKGLGWFSIGLGLAGLLAPRSLSRLAGVNEHPILLRLIGLRELASGAGILSVRRPANWLWARVAGDAMDLAFLGIAMGSAKPNKGRLAATTLAVAGITALDLQCSQRLSMRPGTNSIHLVKTITVNRSPEDLYRFWHNFQSLPRFMNHLEDVKDHGNGRSHWVAKGPAGSTVEWDAEIINDKPNELIAWRSVEGADVDNAGTVRFERATGGRGTVVKVEIEYRPPAGALGQRIAMLFGEAPEKQVHVDLHRFKQLMETGEIARTEGQSAGRSTSTSRRFDDFVRR